MTTVQIILGILLFALVTAVLYVWGLKKSLTQGTELERILLNKSAAKVVKYLKKHQTISQKEMSQLCTGVRGGQFWSRTRISVQNPQRFAQQLSAYMMEQLLVEQLPNGRYQLRK